MTRPFATALMLTAACAAPADAARREGAMPDRFDGTWSVEIITEQGACDRAYRYPVRIEGGRARFVGTAVEVRGAVARNGALKGSVSTGAATADVVGRLGTNGFGTGTWIASGSLACRGRWNAERRG